MPPLTRLLTAVLADCAMFALSFAFVFGAPRINRWSRAIYDRTPEWMKIAPLFQEPGDLHIWSLRALGVGWAMFGAVFAREVVWTDLLRVVATP